MVTPDRSPRPTSAPAIAQSHITEPTPPAVSESKAPEVTKSEKELVRKEVKREETVPEKGKTETLEGVQVCQTVAGLCNCKVAFVGMGFDHHSYVLVSIGALRSDSLGFLGRHCPQFAVRRYFGLILEVGDKLQSLPSSVLPSPDTGREG